MRILVFQHTEDCPAGSTEVFFQNKGVHLTTHLWGKDKNRDDLDSFDGLIILGGPQNVDEEDQFPWLKEEKRQIRSFLLQKKMTLGICLGAQLMAEVLGAEVKRHDYCEVGWHAVNFQPECSPLISHSLPEMQMFHWHGYQFNTPAGGLRFAGNSATQNQGFVWQDNAVGLQFHPESTKEWTFECADDPNFPEGPFVQRPQEIKQQVFNLEKMQSWYFQLLEKMFLLKSST